MLVVVMTYCRCSQCLVQQRLGRANDEAARQPGRHTRGHQSAPGMSGNRTSDSCLLAAVMEMPPWTMLGPSRLPASASGIMMDLLRIIQERLKLCFRLTVVDRLDFGIRLNNGSYTGFVGIVQRREVDMSLTPLSPTPERRSAVDYGEWVLVEDYQLIYTRPFPKADLSGFVKPFTFPVWVALLASFLFFSAMTIFGMAMQSRSKDMSRGNKSNGGQSGDPSADSGNSDLLPLSQKSLQWTMSHLLMQSTSWQPRGTVLRVMAGVWLLSSLVLVTLYGSSLKAMLILPRVALPFTTLEELANTNIPVLTVNGTYMHSSILQAPADSALGRLKKQLNVTKDVRSTIGMVMRGEGVGSGFVSILHLVLGQSFAQNGYCKHYVCESFFSSTMGMIFPKGSTIAPRFSKIISRLRESGLLLHMYKANVHSASECLGGKGSSPTPTRPLELGDFYGVFSLYIGGLCSGLVALALEVALPPRQ